MKKTGGVQKNTQNRSRLGQALSTAGSSASKKAKKSPTHDVSTSGRALGGTNEGYTGSGKALGAKVKRLATRRRRATK